MKTTLEYRWRTSGADIGKGQRGIALIVALLVLVSMTLAGVALMRSVDSATLLSTNLAFRQSATASADKGVEAAIQSLRTKALTPAKLEADDGAYLASLPVDDIDFTGSATPTTATDDFNWSAGSVASAADSAGNKYAYVIHRLCEHGTKALTAEKCFVWMGSSSEEGETVDAAIGAEIYRNPSLDRRGSPARGMYRITVRVAGPRNTFSYVQATVVI